MTTNENLVLNLPYNEIYDRIVMLKKGAYQLDSNNEDDVENCKWLAGVERTLQMRLFGRGF